MFLDWFKMLFPKKFVFFLQNILCFHYPHFTRTYEKNRIFFSKNTFQMENI